MTRRYDVVVVGGGIHGAGVAQAAAAAGHSVLLVERHDLAHGTSSRSSKLIHGGLRYLETGQLRLVRESLMERQLLLRLAPELVRLRPFFVPVYATTRFGLPAFEAQVGLLAASLVAAALVAPFGALSDRFGRRAVIAPALVAFAALFWLFMHRLAAEPDVANLWLLQGVGALFAAFAGPVPALMTEIFPVYLRATGASLAFNLAGALFGGLAPAINGAHVQATGNAAAPAYYIAFVAVLGLIGLAGLPRRSPA